ncbi:MAG: NUDIX domain-containing protein [Chloroflexi bacterium]|nr:MAG: NUDIX domain-containing protein [Chloroflexota bacterium]
MAALRGRPRLHAPRAAPPARGAACPGGRCPRGSAVEVAGVSPTRPDLVECWVYRAGARGLEILLIHRAPGRILPGLWQCVTGSVEPSERVAAAALREVLEETGYGPDAVEAFYDLDIVNQ